MHTTLPEIHRAVPLAAAPQPLSIAFVSTQRMWHGGEEQLALLAEGLKARGMACHLFARHDGEFARRMESRGWQVERFAGRGRTPWACWRLRRRLGQLRPDILHYNDPHAITAAGIASWGLRIPLRLAARRVDFPLRSVTRYQHLCDGLICVSRAVRQMCLQAGLAADRVHLVHDGVDPDRMHQGNRDRGRAALGLPDERPLLLTIAKLTEHKGHRYLLAGLPKLVERYPDLIWAIAGDGPLRASLMRQVEDSGLAAHVRFLGYRSDVPDLLAAADVLVAPSFLEGLNSTIVDAMIAGCPVVATTAGGIPDLLDRRGTSDAPVGWLVAPRDSQSLAHAIDEVLYDPSRAAQRAARAKQRALQAFTAERMIDNTLRIYRQALNQRTKLVEARRESSSRVPLGVGERPAPLLVHRARNHAA